MKQSARYRDCLRETAKVIPFVLIDADLYREIARTAGEAGYQVLTFLARLIVLLTYPISIFVIAFALRKSRQAQNASHDKLDREWMS
ncbi:hypothetical protein OVY01_20820 [Robbsia sp. Bb-Pol-6]|uniref:Uncharacterized protein n=1 Tax=Robbsia betulipollinis TaxID=2981849 RepID=A0ABT3ZSR7_9BURK|nr:hypothetical protein [Robbsia betulipollinis]MCY0389593.1 hypothetical protein [Robbsia betulipollinis]